MAGGSLLTALQRYENFFPPPPRNLTFNFRYGRKFNVSCCILSAFLTFVSSQALFLDEMSKRNRRVDFIQKMRLIAALLADFLCMLSTSFPKPLFRKFRVFEFSSSEVVVCK